MTNLVRVADLSMPHRLGQAAVRLTGTDGRPLAHTDVVVRQTRHAFLFGNIAFDLAEGAHPTAPPQASSSGPDWLDLFNLATLPFYWRRFEPEPGHPHTAHLREAAELLRQRGVRIKGHPLTWHTLAPLWLRGVEPDEVAATLRARITRDVGQFAGSVTIWDAVNEPTILPHFTAEPNAITELAHRIGRLGVLRLAFDTARAADPAATLVLNDFDLSPAFERVIEDALDAGLPLDAIGLQTHMHQGFRGEDALSEIVQRFARLGLPIHMTETSLVSGHLMPPEIVDLNDYQVASWPSTPEGEARQADEIVRHYRCLLAEPSVQAITYWGLCDAGAWLGAPIGLLRADGTRKPAYDALHALIKGEWWIGPTSVRTDDDGRFDLHGFLGDYRVECAHKHTDFSLAQTDAIAVTLAAGCSH